MIRLDFLRHGEPVGGKRIRGHGVDDPLSETGWEQMWQAVGGVEGAQAVGWDQVVSSPLRRCLDFATALAQHLELPLTVDEDLKEVGFGAWEGLDFDTIREQQSELYKAFKRNALGSRPAGAEPLEVFRARVDARLEHLFRQHANQQVLVVTHAGVIRATLAHVLDIPSERMYRLSLPYAARLRLSLDGGQLQAEFQT
ncbi:histidine phosphatase family protein [Thiorhodospira sibirica]|uniref:histidine phosphatase family protein n=1 Tax=Thiorhodospira sibirica TaxID=154347 RepID=UPI00022C5E60|nr:histidine phosphatase family protein [Thiorhodospira sibirica]